MTNQPLSGYRFVIIDKLTGRIIRKLNRSNIPAREFIKKSSINLKESDVIIFEGDDVDKLDIPNEIPCNRMKYDSKSKKVIDNRPDVYIYKFKQVINLGENSVVLNTKIIKSNREWSKDEIEAFEKESNTNGCTVFKTKRGENNKNKWSKLKEVKKSEKV